MTSVPATAVDIIAALEAVVVALGDRETRLVEATAVCAHIIIAQYRTLRERIRTTPATGTQATCPLPYPRNQAHVPAAMVGVIAILVMLAVTLGDGATGLVEATAVVVTAATTHMH